MDEQLPAIDKNTALLIVDLQQGFINENTDHLPAKINNLIDRYGLVVATRFYNPEGSAFRTLMRWQRCAEGSPETELLIKDADNITILDKGRYSCVTHEFLSLLDEHDIRTVHIAGCDTNMCVMTCAVDLFQTDSIRPVILSPYCGSHSGTEFHDKALALLEKAIGKEQIWNPA